MRWAIINTNTNTVDNIIIWDGCGELYPYQSNELVSLGADEWCDIGASYDSSADPRFTPAPVVTEET